MELKRFFVSWEIELDAEDPRDAARQALAMQRDPDSTTQVFSIMEVGGEDDYFLPEQIDLWADDETSAVSPSEEDGYQGPGVGSNA